MFLILISLAVIWGFLGKLLPLRRLYIEVLLKIFAFGSSVVGEVNTKNVNNEEDDCETQGEEKSVSLGRQLNGSADGSVKTNGNYNSVISREVLLSAPDLQQAESKPRPIDDLVSETTDVETNKLDFQLASCFDFIKAGVEAIIEDEVTSRFEAEELKNWNLLTRTNRRYEFISWRLTVIWVWGFFVRYILLLPLRVTICFVGVWYIIMCTAIVGCLPDGNLKQRTVRFTLIHCFEFISTALSTVINYHNVENRPLKGICVANHTSPIDVLMLMCDNCYSLIGQSHGGFLGLLQRALARASPHIWFERAEAKDRLAVAKRLRAHVSESTNPPILIFPGKCITFNQATSYTLDLAIYCLILSPQVIEFF